MKVYLLHFSAGIRRTDRHHIRHCLGATKSSVLERLRAHTTRRGSALVAECAKRGIEVRLARVWSAKDKDAVFTLERALKRRRNHARYCGFCAGRHMLMGPRENA